MEQLKNKTVLVFGEDNRSFLAVVRSLAKAGMKVDAVSFSKLAPALKSKYIDKVYFFNHLSMTLEQWKDEVIALIDEKNYDLVIPCDERSLFPLIEIQKQVKNNTVFALPNEDILTPLFDKSATRNTAKKCDIPVANGQLMNLSGVDFSDLVTQFEQPLVLKPTQSYTEENLNKRQDVKIVHNESEYQVFVKHNSDADCLVESFFSGYGVGVSVLASEGVINTAFSHARVAEPETGGGSSYRKSISIEPSMLAACQKFCQQLKYTGVAMFEFKRNPENGSWILIEVNARFWGSLPLAIFAGVDFPAKYASLLLGYKVDQQFSYNEGVYARCFAADVYAMKAEFDLGRSRKGNMAALGQLAKRLFSFSRVLIGKESIDAFQWQDKKPFYAEFYSLFSDKLYNLPFIKEHRQKQRIASFKQKLQAEENPQEVFFICYGNIMRSPFASELFQKKIKNTAMATTKVDSFGFHQMVNRRAQPGCITMATSWKIDLSLHKSKLVRQQNIIKGKPLVIIFDHKNESILTAYYPEVNFISLADLIPKNKGFHAEIEDPYGKSTAQLRNCYQLIDSGLDELIEILCNNHSGRAF